MPTLQGVFAPALTPFRADLSPDVARWVDHGRRLLNDGCHGLCPFGTTSEATSLSPLERAEMLEQLIGAGIGPAQLMPGTGLSSIPETVQLTRHAVEQGVAGVLMLPPFFYKGVSDDGLFRHFAEVIERVGDERLRIYLYHIPQVTHVGFGYDLIGRLIDAYPQTIVGIKDSSGDWENLSGVIERFPNFTAFAGTEMLLLNTLRAGGAGTISAVANVAAVKIRTLYDAYRGGASDKELESLNEEATATRRVVKDYAAVPALKQIMARQTGDATWKTVRPPLVQMGDGEAEKMMAKLDASIM